MMPEGKAVSFGFRGNGCQLFFHFVMAILIGVTLKLTTFTDALLAASSTDSSHTLQTAFLVSFGFTKAFSNLLVGRMSDLHGRKLPHCVGWMAGIVLGALLLAIAFSTDTTSSHNDKNNDSSWTWYVVANVFLGAQQGLTWTTNIFMFIDILGPDNRALASGISNSTGYLSSAITTYLAAALSTEGAFSVVLASSLLGLVVSVVGMKDTTEFVLLESSSSTQHDNSIFDAADDEAEDKEIRISNNDKDGSDLIRHTKEGECSDPSTPQCPTRIARPGSEYELVGFSSSTAQPKSSSSVQTPTPIITPSSFGSVLLQTSWHNPSTAILLVAGLMTNLVTSLAWGLVLIWARQQALDKFQVANIGSTFTFSKAAMMILASRMSDYRQTRKPILIGGFLTAIVGLIITALADMHHHAADEISQVYIFLLIGGIVIGCGIGSVYCVMAGAISDHTPAIDRASAIGIYKLWRDSGYAVGALLTGILADVFNGSFVITTLIVACMVGALVICIFKFYHDVRIPS